MKKLLLLLLITTCLPVQAQEPVSIPDIFGQQSTPKYTGVQRKVLQHWRKENTNNDISKRIRFITDQEIQSIETKPNILFISNSIENNDFNNTIKKEPSITQIISNNTTNWTQAEAREKLFNNIEYSKNVKAFPKKDPDYKTNKKALKQGLEKFGNRYLTLFSDKTYSVIVLTDELYNKRFFYSKRGKLQKVSYSYYPEYVYNAKSLEKAWDNGLQYPYKEYCYTAPKGKLDYTSLTQNTIAYLFNIDRSLNSYWINGAGYDDYNDIFMTSKTFKF